MFGPELDKENIVVVHTAPDSQKPFLAYVGRCLPDLHFVGAATGTTCIPLYRYDAEGERHDNLTDWGLRHFQAHYGDKKITKLDIFHYTYAVLHHPAYRAKYEINLKREFPRLPYYDDFRQWAKWGKALMALHLDYEQARPFPLKRHDRKESAGKQSDLLPDERLTPARLLDDKPALKPKLRADKESGSIEIDAMTTLDGIPAEAWAYRLGHRSGLEWVIEQWKESKISDPTIAEKFNTYRFADHKEHVIDLLRRVCTVSVETMKILRSFPD
jgi:predicted helicase